MATYVIGDIQGCFQELQSLLALTNFQPKQDRLWMVGDLVNRGPQSLEVLNFLYQQRDACKIVLGNHDLHCLACYANVRTCKPEDTLLPLLSAPNIDELMTWLRQQPLAYYDKPLDTLMVHAGIAPSWDLNLTLSLAKEISQQLQGAHYQEFLVTLFQPGADLWQDQLTGFERLRTAVNYFTRVRIIDAQGKIHFRYKKDLAQIPAGYWPWYQNLSRMPTGTRIVFGHWAALLGETKHKKAINLDTGCVWGKRLTALRLEDGAKFSVPAQLVA